MNDQTLQTDSKIYNLFILTKLMWSMSWWDTNFYNLNKYNIIKFHLPITEN